MKRVSLVELLAIWMDSDHLVAHDWMALGYQTPPDCIDFVYSPSMFRKLAEYLELEVQADNDSPYAFHNGYVVGAYIPEIFAEMMAKLPGFGFVRFVWNDPNVEEYIKPFSTVLLAQQYAVSV